MRCIKHVLFLLIGCFQVCLCIQSDPNAQHLFAAARQGNLVAIEALLQAGTDANVREEHGLTALLEACISPNIGRLDVVKALIAGGADVNAADAAGETALHYAVRQGDTGLAQVLLDNGVDVTIWSKKGYTAGFLAIVLTDSDPKIYEVLNLILQSRSHYWLTIPDMSYRTIWQRASKEDRQHLPPEPSFWALQYMTFTEDPKIWLPIGTACLGSVPLTMLIVFLETSSTFGAGGEEGHQQLRQSSENRAGVPSPGAQQLAAKATARNLVGPLAFRMLEVFTATVLPAWTFGYYLMPRLSLAILTMVYIAPTPLLVGLVPALRYPALLLASAPQSIVRDPSRALRQGLPIVLVRCAVLLAFPWVIIKLPNSWMPQRFNSRLELPSMNEWSIAHPDEQYPEGKADSDEFDCLLAPSELLQLSASSSSTTSSSSAASSSYDSSSYDSSSSSSNSQLQEVESPCLGLWMPWAHVFLPALLLASAVGASFLFRMCSRRSDFQATQDNQYLEWQHRELALAFDRIASEAHPDDPHVWERILKLLENEHPGSKSWVEPPRISNFWKTPYFDLGLLALDFFSDILTMFNVFAHRHFHLGSILLAVLLSSTASEVWIGNTPRVLLHEARESARIGFRTERFQAMQLHEVGYEALPSLAVSVFTFWFNVNSRIQLVVPMVSLSTSILGLAKFLHRKLDLELPGNCEEQEQHFLLPAHAYAREQELVGLEAPPEQPK